MSTLIKLDEETISSAVSSVSLGASDWDSSYNVYKVIYSNVTVSASNTIDIQFLANGSANTSTNYSMSARNFWAGGGDANNYAVDNTDIALGNTIHSSSNQQSNAHIYLFNFNDAGEYSFITFEETAYNPDVVGRQGGGVLKVSQANNGVLFKAGTGNMNSGKFTLYGIKK